MASGKAPDDARTRHPYGRDPDAIERPVYSATIRPHCSLSRLGFRVVMAFCGGVALVTGIAFLQMGMWPVTGFFGLDIAALWLALTVNARRGRSFEQVVISQIEVWSPGSATAASGPSGASTRSGPGCTRSRTRNTG